MWLLAGVLGGYLIRKPGAALYCEIVAAVISVFLTGGAWSQSILIAGFFQGIGAEIAFAVFGYRVWNLSTAAFAGALSGLFMGVNEIIIYYQTWKSSKPSSTWYVRSSQELCSPGYSPGDSRKRSLKPGYSPR